MSQPAEELHQRNLTILAKLATSTNNIEVKENVLCETKNKLNMQQNNYSMSSKCTLNTHNECNKNGDKENAMPEPYQVGVETPRKRGVSAEPVTPTTNLKMLVSAASDMRPAIAKVDAEKRTLFGVNFGGDENEDAANTKGKIKRGELMGRKEKSLGLLCKKFMSIYPEYPSVGVTVMLDDVVKSLSIGRRRVYDIVNVLESMEMMVRQAKNKYIWFGKSRLPATLSKLKALALRVYGPNIGHMLKRFCGIIGKPKSAEYKKNCFILPKIGNVKPLNILTAEDQNIPTAPSTESGERVVTSENSNQPKVDDLTSSIMDSIISFDFTRRDCNKSLGILCQKFIMLFMVTEDSIVSLDRAAKLLITEPEEGPGKYKTKIRRLYDIANILTSMNFLKKCVSYEDSTKKAAYKWIGLNLNEIDIGEDASKAFLSQEYSLTRHSLLTQAPRSLYKSANDINKSKQRKLQCRSSSALPLSLNFHSKSSNELESKQIRLLSVRTLSDTMINHDANIDGQNSDGFDIENFEDEIEIEATIEENSGKENEENVEKSEKVCTEPDSPNQARFKEKLRNLQQEFPDKLSSNGLLELLLACKENPAKVPHSSRRRLSSDFESSILPDSKRVKMEECAVADCPSAWAKKSPLCGENNITSSLSMYNKKFPITVASCNSVSAVSVSCSSSYVEIKSAHINKPLPPNTCRAIGGSADDDLINAQEDISDGDNRKSNYAITLHSKLDSNDKKPTEIDVSNNLNNSDGTFTESQTQNNADRKVSGYFTIPAAFKPVQASHDPQNITTMLLSPLHNPLSIPKSGLYQIIPLQCPTLAQTNECAVLQPVNLPIPQSCEENRLSTAKSVIPILMRPPIATVTSPSLARCRKSVSKDVDSTSHHFSANLPELVTPPHVLYQTFNKPAANPIVFPKMTPETPSCTTQISQSVLTNVSRKLMSLHKDTD